MFLKLFQLIEDEGTVPNLFQYWTTITLLPKLEKDTIKKKKKNSTKCLQNKFKNTKKCHSP